MTWPCLAAQIQHLHAAFWFRAGFNANPARGSQGLCPKGALLPWWAQRMTDPSPLKVGPC